MISNNLWITWKCSVNVFLLYPKSVDGTPIDIFNTISDYNNKLQVNVFLPFPVIVKYTTVLSFGHYGCVGLIFL
jgi:hypothetical protein